MNLQQSQFGKQVAALGRAKRQGRTTEAEPLDDTRKA